MYAQYCCVIYENMKWHHQTFNCSKHNSYILFQHFYAITSEIYLSGVMYLVFNDIFFLKKPKYFPNNSFCLKLFDIRCSHVCFGELQLIILYYCDMSM